MVGGIHSISAVVPVLGSKWRGEPEEVEVGAVNAVRTKLGILGTRNSRN